MSDGQTWVVVGGFVAMLVAMFTVIPWLFRAQSAEFRARFDALDAKFDARCDGLEAKFDARCDGLEAKFDATCDSTDAKLSSLASEVHVQGERLDRVEERLTGVEQRLTGVEHQVTALRSEVDHLSTTMTPIVDELLRAGVTGRPRAAG